MAADAGSPGAADRRSGAERLRDRLRARLSPPSPPPWRVEGAERKDRPDGRARRSRWWWLLLVLLVVNWVITSLVLAPAPRTSVSYTFFLSQVDARNVQGITSTNETIDGAFTKAVAYAPQGQHTQQVVRFTTQRPAFATDDLFRQLQSTGVQVNANPPDQGPPLWEQLLLGFGPTLLLFYLLYQLSKRVSGGAGTIGTFGRSRATLYKPDEGPRTTFADVAGIDEVEDELSEIVDFLREPERYRKLGAQIPRGVLLTGPPGHRQDAAGPGRGGRGRRAVLLDLRLGVHRDDRRRRRQPSTRPVRPGQEGRPGDHLHRRAGRHRPGPRRRAIASAATTSGSRPSTRSSPRWTASPAPRASSCWRRPTAPEVLDPALLRPGRFDRRVTVSPPDLTGRRQILAVHTRAVPAGAPTSTSTTSPRRRPAWWAPTWRTWSTRRRCWPPAAGTPGSPRPTSPTRSRRSSSAPCGGSCCPPEERERTAYHESGHALLGMLHARRRPGAQGVDHPAGAALGVTFQSSDGRPVRLLRDVPAWADRRRARRAGRRGGRLQRRHHRRRERPRPGHARSRGRWWAGGACPRPSGRSPCSRRPVRSPRSASTGPVAGHEGAGRPRGPPHRRRVPRRGGRHPGRPPRPARPAGADAAGEGDARRGRGLRCRRSAARHGSRRARTRRRQRGSARAGHPAPEDVSGRGRTPARREPVAVRESRSRLRAPGCRHRRCPATYIAGVPGQARPAVPPGPCWRNWGNP